MKNKIMKAANILSPRLYRKHVAKKILGMMKKRFGKDLMVVGVGGSASRFIKRADVDSDLDIVCIISKKAERRMKRFKKSYSQWESIVHGLSKSYGITLELLMTNHEKQKTIEKTLRLPALDIIYGKSTAKKLGLEVWEPRSSRKYLRHVEAGYLTKPRRPILGLPARIKTARRK